METNTSINHITPPDAKPVLAAALPNLEFGIGCINSFNSFMIAVRMGEDVIYGNVKEHSKMLCRKIFDKKTAQHLEGKFSFADVAGFFLNLDNKNQIAFLKHAFEKPVDLELPNIPNYKEIGEKYGMDDWEHYNQEDVRSLAVGFHELNEWDAYPHALVWIRRWCLYSINNSISDKSWNGEKYGNYTNWMKYFPKMSTSQKFEFVKMLVSYS